MSIYERRKHKFIKWYIITCIVPLLTILSACGDSGPTRPSQTPFQQLPEGLLNPNLPVLDRMFGYRCGINAYQASSHNSMAVTGDGWVIPDTGEIVTGGNNSCDVTGLASVAHQDGAKAYLTLGVDASQNTPLQLASYLKHAVDNPALLDMIVSKAEQGHYDGVILDYETVDANFPNIRQIFQHYCMKLREKLQAQNPTLPLGIDIIHKTGDVDPFYNLNAFEDWNLLGQNGVCDFFVLMSLDENLSQPGPGVEWSWVQAQLQYLEQTMPQALSKTIWLFPVYGAKWQQKGDGS